MHRQPKLSVCILQCVHTRDVLQRLTQQICFFFNPCKMAFFFFLFTLDVFFLPFLYALNYSHCLLGSVRCQNVDKPTPQNCVWTYPVQSEDWNRCSAHVLFTLRLLCRRNINPDLHNCSDRGSRRGSRMSVIFSWRRLYRESVSGMGRWKNGKKGSTSNVAISLMLVATTDRLLWLQSSCVFGTWENFHRGGKCVFLSPQPSLVTVTSVLDTKPEVKGIPLLMCLVSNPTISQPTCHSPKSGKVIPHQANEWWHSNLCNP